MVKLVLKFVGGLILLLILAALAGLGYRAYRQHQLALDLAIRTPNGVDERLFVKAGGIEQWITIRGEDRSNPIILFVHGGPAETHSYFPTIYQPWEKDFTIVQWDQRGAGRTYGRNAKPPVDLNLKQMTQDGVEVAAWVAQHLGQSKVILIGHSWGTILGEHMVLARTGLFSAYVGTGQFVSWSRMVESQYAYSLDRAETERNATKLAALNEVGPPPYPDLGKYIAFRQATQDDAAPSDAAFIAKMRDLYLYGPRVSIIDVWNEMQGGRASFAALGPDLFAADLPALGYDFPVPFFVIQGAEDHITRTELLADYFKHIKAPNKAMVVIEGAGHFAAMTDTKAFLAALVDKVRPVVLAPPVQPAP